MTPFKSDITIQRPVEQVFEFVAAPENYSKWMSGVTDAALISNAFGPGAKVQLTGRAGFWVMDAPMQVTAYEPNRVFGMKGMVGPMFFDGTWEFESHDNSTTQLTVSGGFALQGLWRLAEPLMAGEVRSGEAKELQKIKQQLEAPS